MEIPDCLALRYVGSSSPREESNSMRTVAARRDANEQAIIEALRAIGAIVQPLSAAGVPDLAVYFRGWHMLEVKTAKGKLTELQKEWDEKYGPGAVSIVRNIEDAYKAIGAEVSE